MRRRAARVDRNQSEIVSALRKIAAVAKTPAECFATLKSNGNELSHFEVIQLPEAF